MNSHKKLKVYRISMDLVLSVYKIAKDFLKNEKSGLLGAYGYNAGTNS